MASIKPLSEAVNILSDLKEEIKKIVRKNDFEFYSLSEIHNGNQKFLKLEVSVKIIS